MTAVLIDASGYIYRAFYASPPMERSDGLPTGCIHGFCTMLWNLKKREANATHFAVVFDKGKSAYRMSIYPEYKANRSPTPDDMKRQIPFIRDSARAFGFPVVEQDNVEADDLIASYATAFEALDHEVLVVSSDKDLYQLIGDKVSMYDPIKRRIVTNADVEAKLGVTPERAIDAQALIGDSVDNVPGAPGIGPKTAGQLLAQFGSLNALFAGADRIRKEKQRDTILRHRDQIMLSRSLVALRCDLQLPVPLKDLEATFVDAEAIAEFGRQMEFISLVDEIEKFYRIGEHA